MAAGPFRRHQILHLTEDSVRSVAASGRGSAPLLYGQVGTAPGGFRRQRHGVGDIFDPSWEISPSPLVSSDAADEPSVGSPVHTYHSLSTAQIRTLASEFGSG